MMHRLSVGVLMPYFAILAEYEKADVEVNFLSQKLVSKRYYYACS